MGQSNHGATPDSKGKEREAPSGSSSASKHSEGDGDGTQEPNHSSSDASLIGRITTSAASLSRVAFSNQPEHLSSGGSGKAMSGTTSASAQQGETATYRHTTGPGPGVGQAFAHQRHPLTTGEAHYNEFLGSQDNLQSRGPSQPETALQHQRGASSAIGQQEGQDGQQVADLLNMPGEDYEGIDDSIQPFLSPQEEESLREALFGRHNGERVGSNWAVLLDFRPDFLWGNSAAEIQHHFGNVEPQRARELWMDGWNEVLTSYTDEVWGDLGSLAREAQKELEGAREYVANPTSVPTPTPTPTRTPTAAYLAGGALLSRRQDCPAGTNLCSSSLGEDFDGICCASGQVCGYDDSNRPACCPSGAVCTGTAPTTAPAAPTAVSYVPNQYFPFPFIAMSLDRGECSDAVQQCSRNYESCVTQLNGDAGFGVTVAVPGGGGTTVAATRPDVGTSATPICSSLSSQACHGINNDQCSQTTTVSGVFINAAARPTAACIASIAAGVGIVMFGAMR
ncbi:hypothetical protein CkaCkLH20_12733 [Colletotrichum karsti]|uniref:Uncharacterized protein n=1 Tax=Colletotrichum karsti TaxID=1095194 RepID=A0A9P6HVU9_9PEZI|nr:uncharacterized protein CkaCkLH20_12733 [Colletotrichum karsti]KAF9869816.1 hypothetical protein CkaCkLH20_12733 [Colletotrichum karsti]